MHPRHVTRFFIATCPDEVTVMLGVVSLDITALAGLEAGPLPLTRWWSAATLAGNPGEALLSLTKPWTMAGIPASSRCDLLLDGNQGLILDQRPASPLAGPVADAHLLLSVDQAQGTLRWLQRAQQATLRDLPTTPS
jgi:hypothetical protein